METTAVLEQPNMSAKKRADRTAYASVKLPEDVMETARIVAAYRGETIAEMLGAMLRPMLARMEQEEIGKRARASEPPKAATRAPKGRGAK